ADADGDLHLGQERHAVFAAQVAVEVALLPAVALGLAHHAGGHVQVFQRPQHRLSPERLDDDGQQLHRALPAGYLSFLPAFSSRSLVTFRLSVTLFLSVLILVCSSSLEATGPTSSLPSTITSASAFNCLSTTSTLAADLASSV